MIKNRAEFKGWFIFVLITYQIIRNFGIFSQQFCAENKPTFKFGTGMRGAIRIFCLICGIFSALPVYAADIPAARELLSSIDISNSDNIAPEILAAYQALEQSVQDAENLNRQYQADLQENADAMHETEQSLENRMLGGAAMATTGIGAMQLGAAMAEQSADAAAQRDMSAYLATFRCDYGAGANIQGGETNITLPGANTLLTLRTEYMDLAADIKIRKESLGLPPGIESETILDATQYNLYNNESIGITDGAYASVSRALTNTGGDDATEWAAMKSETAEQLKSGAIAAGIGAVGSAVANMVINKDAPQERSREITNEYNNKLQTIESEIDEKQNALLTAINENEQRIAEYNELLNQHNEFIATITPECMEQFSDYIAFINNLEPITDEMANTASLPVIEYDLDELRAQLNQCISSHQQMIDEFNSLLNQHLDFIKNMDNAECREKMNDYITYISGLSELDYTATEIPDLSHYDLETQKTSYQKCVDDAIVAAQEELQQQIDECNNRGDGYEWQDGECVDTLLCPSENPRFRGAAGKRVGASCSYGNVAVGHIFKFKSGTRRDGVDVGGTCSCSADECKTGYKLSGGMCTECDDGYHKNEKNECVPDPTGTGAGDISTVANENGDCVEFSLDDPRAKNATNCLALCKQAIADTDCKITSSKMPEPGKCICNPNVAEEVDVEYFSVCSDDAGKTNGTEICEDELFETLRVQPTGAVALAQEYARVKHKDTSVKCNPSVVECKNNRDCIQCTSTRQKKYYEFVFRKTDASADANIVNGALHGLCGIFGLEYMSGGKTNALQTLSGGTLQSALEWPAYCKTNSASKCTEIYPSAERFGYEAKMSNIHSLSDNGTFCALWAVDAEGIINDYSTLDPYYFKKTGGNWYLSATLQDQICQYVEKQINPIPLESCKCNDVYTQIPERENSVYKDDVLTCKVNGDDVYFVFDDLSETKTKRLESAEEIIQCSIMENGIYTGKQCIGLDQTQCDDLAEAVLTNCPECKRATWDEDTNSCKLPASTKITNIEKGLKLAVPIGMMAAGVVITVVTGGSGTGATIVLVTEATGAIITSVAEVKMSQAAQKFLTTSQLCKDAKCAEQTIKEDLQRMSNLISRFTDAEIQAVDLEFKRLIELVPSDSAIFDNVKSVLIENNQLSFWDADSWEPEQIWAAIGNALQLASLFTSLTGLNKFINSTRAAGNRALNKVDDVALTLTRAQAKRLDDLNIQEEQLLARQRANPSASEAEDIRRQLTTVRQERQTLLNQLGNPSDEALDAAKAEAYRLDELQTAQAELERLQQHRAGLYTTNRNGQQVLRQGATRYDVQDVDRQIAQQQQRIRELGGDVPGAPTTPASAATNAADAAPSSTSAPTAATNNADDAARAADSADDAARATSSAADDAARGADEVGDAARATSSAADDASRVADDADEIVSTPVDEAAENAANSADDAARATGSAADDAANAADDAARVADDADEIVATPVDEAAENAANSADDAAHAAASATDDTNAAARGAVNTSKAARLAAAKQAGRAGYHGTDVNLADDVMLQPSAGSRAAFSGVSIARDIETARNYAINRLVKNQNPHLSNANFDYYDEVLEITTDRPLNLNNKSIYIYELETDSDGWQGLGNSYAGVFGAHFNKNATEWLAKTEENLDDLIASGRVRIIQTNAADDAVDAARAGVRGSGGAANAVRSASEQASDMLNNSEFRTALEQFERTGQRTAVFPRDAVNDDAWDIINGNLESRGIQLRSGTNDGRAVMAFDNIPDSPATIMRLRNRASQNFNTYFDNLKNTGQGVSWPASRLTDDEWKIVNDSLYDDGIRLRSNGNRMIMEEIPDHPATIARQNVRRSLDNILTNFEHVTYRNTPAYVYQPSGLKDVAAYNMAKEITDEGKYYAAALNTEGYAGADHMVIAMSRSDAEKMGYVWNGGDLTYPIDNSRNMARLRQQIGKRLTSIHGTPVVIESMSDFGAVDGRAIVMVKVGNKKLPFYISTGSAGKTGVPTGKWEFFGGITSDGYFRKLDIKSINAHYNSAELRQIANALDNNIGDLRDTELVLETIGRQELGGSGNVAGLYNAQTISRETVNQSFNPEHVKEWDLLAFGEDINEIKNYLRNL